MMNQIRSLTVLSLFVFAAQQSAHATEGQYALVSPKASLGSSVAFAIKYTLGVHEGKANEATGSLRMDPSLLNVIEGNVEVPIASLTTGNDKRDCHVRESFGLDYAKANYPQNHVCDANNTIPSSGNLAVAFPLLRFKFARLVGPSSASTLQPGVPVTTVVAGTLEIHGVTREIQVPLTLTNPSDQIDLIRVESQFAIDLPDYGMVVKKFLFVDVEKTAQVNLNLLFKIQR